MSGEKYKLRLEDFTPIVGWIDYRNRTDREYDSKPKKEVLVRDRILGAYNIAIIICGCVGLKGLEKVSS